MSSLRTLRQRKRGREGMTAASASALGAFLAHYDALELDDGVAVVLFGSRARGDARPDSDLDVAVVVDEGCDRKWLGCWLADRAHEISKATGQEIHAMAFSSEEIEYPDLHANPALVENVLRDGAVLRGSLDIAPAPCM